MASVEVSPATWEEHNLEADSSQSSELKLLPPNVHSGQRPGTGPCL